MATLKALDGQVQMISGEGELFYSRAKGFVEELKKYSTASSHYTVISIIGPQSSGKSYLLNTVFGTNFDVLNATIGRRQTTKGIWIAKCVNPCMIIMDVEGSDGREREEADTLFERRSALFSLTVSDVLLLNMIFQNIGPLQGASYGLLKLIFEERVKIEAPKTTVIILVRDYDYDETSPDITKKDLERNMNELWHKVHATTNRKMSDYIEVIVKDFPRKIERNFFYEKGNKNGGTNNQLDQYKELAAYLCSFAASENHCASSFAYSSQRIWDLICNNKRLSVADHKLAMSAYICNEIKNEILSSLDQETEYWSLLVGTSMTSVKEFNTELLLLLERILTRYEEETRAFDRNIRKEVRGKLEEETLQVFKQTFKDKIDGLYSKKLFLAKPKVRGQLLKLAVRDRSSVIGVTHPYLTEFDDNLPADVHHYFQKILNKRRKEFGVALTLIAEEEAKKIAEEEAKKIAEEQAKKLQMLQLTFEKNIDELCTETLSTAKLKVRAQLNNLRKLDESSIIDVIRPYMLSFDNNLPAEVPRDFLVIVTKYQKKVAEGLKNIAEEEANDIQKKRNIKKGLAVAGTIILRTVVFLFTGDPSGMVDVLSDLFSAASSSNT